MTTVTNWTTIKQATFALVDETGAELKLEQGQTPYDFKCSFQPGKQLTLVINHQFQDQRAKRQPKMGVYVGVDGINIHTGEQYSTRGPKVIVNLHYQEQKEFEIKPQNDTIFVICLEDTTWPVSDRVRYNDRGNTTVTISRI